QNEYNIAIDAADSRALLKNVLSAGSDMQTAEILGITRKEIPEAIKALQRALEKIIEKQSSFFMRRISMQRKKAVSPVAGKIKTLKIVSTTWSLSDSSTDSMRKHQEISSMKRKDMLNQEFMEIGIDAFEGAKANLNLPSWTITWGSSSDVYRRTWLEQTVAIKIVAETTPRNLFIQEIRIWKMLQHLNVLELYGASSASSDPLWFFVSFYLKNRILVEMAYLYNNSMLHGNLKIAYNVLVDDQLCCIISDFGQSEMKLKALCISEMPLPYNTLRWQTPELMIGLSQLTTEIDMYAFVICYSHPNIPLMPFSTSALQELIETCWQKEPSMHPKFSTVIQELKQMQKSLGLSEEVISPELSEWQDNKSFEFHVLCLSSDIHSIPLLSGMSYKSLNLLADFSHLFIAYNLTLGLLQGSPSASFHTTQKSICNIIEYNSYHSPPIANK
ncbi:kinase-like protein, partial [Guyanagaster necrorhizus]